MDASEYRTDQEEQLDMTLNELFAIQEADVTGDVYKRQSCIYAEFIVLKILN